MSLPCLLMRATREVFSVSRRERDGYRLAAAVAESLTFFQGGRIAARGIFGG